DGEKNKWWRSGMKKKLVGFVYGIPLLLAVSACGCAGTKHKPGVGDILREARVKLDANYTGTQSEMTIISQFQLQLATMELYYARYAVWNRSDYGKIEADFLKDEELWEQELKKEQKKPSEFEGGSLAPMDHNLRMTSFIEKRVAELKSKWGGK
ncbi:MAG: hypothetical protein J6R00_12650, partial [Lentisphaeria bacterium]|nr:hypothetical protein [Lentisphaeria bacterium]